MPKKEIIHIKNIDRAEFTNPKYPLDPIIMTRDGQLFNLTIEISVDDPSDETETEAIPTSAA